MAVPTAIEDAYLRIAPALFALGRYIIATLRPWCDERGYLFQERVKVVASVAEKIESGRYRRWSDLDDLFACTIVIPTVAHEDDVLNFLEGAFEPVDLRRRNTTMKPPEAFRFDATRFIGKAREEGLDELPGGAGSILFETQIQTVFEFAWQTVTHDLVYKTGEVDWRRERLAAQLKAAVEQIELIIEGFAGNVDFVRKSEWPAVDQRARLVRVFKQLHDEGFVSDELVPSSWSRFAENIWALVASYSRGARDTTRRMNSLCDSIEAHIRASNPFAEINRGSLFQLVVGLIHSGVVPESSLADFIIVDSSELRDIHGVPDPPIAFEFD